MITLTAIIREGFSDPEARMLGRVSVWAKPCSTQPNQHLSERHWSTSHYLITDFCNING